MEVTCPYCLQAAQQFDTARQVDRHAPAEGPVWGCPACRAWAYQSRDTGAPRARLADGCLRQARAELLAIYEPLVRERSAAENLCWAEARRTVDAWLGQELGLPEVRFVLAWADHTQILAAHRACQPAIARMIDGQRRQQSPI